MIIKRQKAFAKIGTQAQRKKVLREVRALRRERDGLNKMAKKLEKPDAYKKFNGDVALIPSKVAEFKASANIADRKSRETLENFLKNNK